MGVLGAGGVCSPRRTSLSALAAARFPGRKTITDPKDTRIDVKLLKGLVRLMKGGDVTDLEVDDAEKGLRIRLKRGGDGDVVGTPTVQVLGGAAPILAPSPEGEAPAVDDDPDADATEANGIKSPMVGTFYSSSSPDTDPFVSVGDRVEEGTVVCILEAMKVMNEIQAETSGEIAEVLVENGEPVEFGQPLFLLR